MVTNIEFQYILGLSTGMFFGAFSSSIFITFLYIVFFEIVIFQLATYEIMSTFMLERTLINVLFLFGWVLSRIFYLRETGFEPFLDSINICYDTKNMKW